MNEGHTDVDEVEIGAGIRLDAPGVRDVLEAVARQPLPVRAARDAHAKTGLIDEIERRRPDRHGLVRVDDAPAHFRKQAKPGRRRRREIPAHVQRRGRQPERVRGLMQRQKWRDFHQKLEISGGETTSLSCADEVSPNTALHLQSNLTL